MKSSLAIILMGIIGVSAFSIGLMLEVAVEGNESKLQRFMNQNTLEFKSIPLIKSAELSTYLQNIIDTANIGFDIEAVLQDPDGDPNSKDEFFINRIKQCVFHSNENIDGTVFANDDGIDNELDTIDDGVCIFCRLLDENGDLIVEAEINIPEGYIASDTIPIPIPDSYNILTADGVELAIKTSILDLANFAEGKLLDDAYNQFGITISGKKLNGDPISLIVYNTNPSAFDSEDPDLEVNIGNIAIIPHDDNNDGLPDPGTDPANPNDSPDGGQQIYQFNPARYINSLVFVDADRQNANPSHNVKLYRDYSCTDLINPPGSISIDNTAGDMSTQVINVPIQTEKVSCMIVEYNDSGGVASINLGCPLPGDDGDVGCTPGYWKQSQHFDDWPSAYVPSDLFKDAFMLGAVSSSHPGKDLSEKTLLEALQSGAGQWNALGRHAVAGLLSSENDNVDYDLQVDEVKTLVQDLYSVSNPPNSDVESTKNIFAENNEAGCPL